VLTLRADFCNDALLHRGFSEALENGQIPLGPMNYEELKAVIEEPARLLGIHIQGGLTERILADVKEQPGNLPLLEFALNQLWELQSASENIDSKGLLTHDAYSEIGGVPQALARYAEDTFLDLLEPDRKQASKIFVQLVQPGAGTQDTRRITSKAELGEANWQLVAHLADQKLLVSGHDEASQQDTAEVVHEALISNWQRLKEWMNADREFRNWQERLRGAMRQWEKSSRDNGALLRGVPLVEAQGWLETQGPDISQLELDFIEASSQLKKQEELAKQIQEQHERKRLRDFLTVLSILLLLASGLAIFAFVQFGRASEGETNANNQAKIALSRQLAAQATNLYDTNFALALLLSLEAVKVTPTVEAKNNLATALSLDYPPVSLKSGSYKNFLLKGKWLAANDANGNLTVWNIESGDVNGQQLKGLLGTVSDYGYSLSNDGKWLAASDRSGNLVVWNIESGKENGQHLKGLIGSVFSLNFSSDGKWLVASDKSGNLIVWNIESGDVNGQQLKGLVGAVSNYSFSSDGKQLVAGDSSGNLVVWDLQFDNWEKSICQSTNCNLSKAESEQFFGNDSHTQTCPNLPAGQ
jgi:hypothetical protein